MSVVEPTIQVTAREGITPSLGAANADGYALPGDGKVWCQVKNGSGSPITVTVSIPGTHDGLAVTPKTVTIPATTGDKILGPYPPAIYNQLSGANAGKVLMTFSAVTSVTIGFFRLGV